MYIIMKALWREARWRGLYVSYVGLMLESFVRRRRSPISDAFIHLEIIFTTHQAVQETKCFFL